MARRFGVNYEAELCVFDFFVFCGVRLHLDAAWQSR
jgi:hypothetical protein